MNRAQGITNKSVRNIHAQFARSNKNLTSQFSALSKSMAAAFVGSVSLRGAQQLADASTRITNALKVAGLEGDALTKVYDELFASAQRNSTPIEALVTLYGRAAIVQNELKVSTEELLGFTDNVGKALRVAGTDAQSASGALLQLSQTLGAGTVRAEEFNSILEGALPIAQAAAAGLEEAGGSVAKLRALVVDGAVSSEAFFRAFEAGSYILEDKLAGAESTVSQAFVRLQNVLIDTAGELDEGSGASDRLVSALGDLTDAIQNTDFSPAITGTMDFAGAVIATVAEIERMARALGDLTGASQFGEWARGRREEMSAQARIDSAFEGTVASKGDRVGSTADRPLRVDVESGTVRPRVSLKDYAAPSSSNAGGGRRGRAGSLRERADDYERLTKRIHDSIAATVAETEAQRNLNPLIDDYGYAVEKARLEQELLTAAKEAGRAVTPQLRAEIAALADQYALATVEAAQLAEKQDDVRQAAADAAEFNKDLARGIVDGFVEGKKAADIFADALRNVGNRLLDMAFDAAFSTKGGGGFLGSLLGGIGSLFTKREFGGPVRAGQPYIVGEKRPELFVPNQSGHIVPRIPAALGKSAGGAISAPVNITIDARGADREGLARVEQQVAKLKAELPAHVINTVRQAQKGRQL
ncbi:tape measure protein [Tianweitania sediminis]|uniref:Tape measure protein n=2 Tax=Tianweitania sediminis TaxID=1502156 RepID=A0A8J7ULM4_9HYPH|nr:tape measure protein [Tianweitania sediminis]